MKELNSKKSRIARHSVRKKRIDRISFAMCTGFCFITVLIMLLILFIPDKEMSEKENRVLAQKPALTLSSITSGKFMKDFESYLTDQFPLRDKIISFKTFVDRSVGKKEENGVLIGKDGFLFENQTDFDEENVKSLTSAINTFSENNKNLKKAFILSPNSSYVLNEYLPTGIKPESQKLQLNEIKKQLDTSGISWISCIKAFDLQEDKTELFYRTDHHWTTKAAYLAFDSLADSWKLSLSKTKYEFSSVSNSFQGTLASSSGVGSSTDEIQICIPTSPKISYVVNYESSNKKTATLFDKDKLSQKNQYEVFLGGNYDKVIISTSADTDDTLLLLKDSYANCMIPMMTPYFSKIVVIDPRYFSDSLADIMKEYSFTHVLFLYNLNTFLADNSLVDALES
ncbi:MAG: DHHW family protein [Acutalibacteraceae bacterium]